MGATIVGLATGVDVIWGLELLIGRFVGLVMVETGRLARADPKTANPILQSRLLGVSSTEFPTLKQAPQTLGAALIKRKRAYRNDLDHFRAWGGTLPSSDAQLAAYLAANAETLSVATLVRRLAGISVAHEAHGLPNPVRSPLVRATMRGIRRERGSAQGQAKPLLRDDLFAILAATGDGLKDIRDRALLLIGFAGGFRRAELVTLGCADIEHVRQGIVITLRRSKTDQEGVGRKIGIPLGRTRWCPVAALDRWLAAAGIEAGPVFRRVDRHGRASDESLSPEAVSLVVRERVAAAGFDPSGYSGHSLRGHERRAGRGLDSQGPSADRPCKRCDARALCPGR